MNDELEKAKAEEAKKEPTGEIMDRAERRALKEKKKKEAAEKKGKKLDAIDEAMATGKMGEQKKAARKKQFKMGLYGGLAALVAWGGFYLFKPFEAGVTFGICKTYLETNVQFPQYLRLSSIEEFESYIRIWYTQLDAFGEYRMENIECHFAYDDQRGSYVEKIMIDRREEDPAKVEKFNTVLPVVLASPMDLTRPQKLPDSLGDLQLDADAFRFQVNIPGFN